MTSTKSPASLSNRRLSFMLGLLLVLVWAADPLVAQRRSGGGRGTHPGPRGGHGMGGHPGHFDGRFGGGGFFGHRSFSGLGGPHFSLGLGFHAGDLAFGFGGPFGDHRFSRRFGFGAPYRGLGYDLTPCAGSYAYDRSAYLYGSRSSYPLRPGLADRGEWGDPSKKEIQGRSNESDRLDLRAEPARLVLSIPPTRAEVYLDGRLIGRAADLRHREGFLIDAGEHRLETVHPTFENRTFDFSAAPGETVELE